MEGEPRQTGGWVHNSSMDEGMRDAGATVARHPHLLTIRAAVEVTAAAVLRHECVEGGEHLRLCRSFYSIT